MAKNDWSKGIGVILGVIVGVIPLLQWKMGHFDIDMSDLTSFLSDFHGKSMKNRQKLCRCQIRPIPLHQDFLAQKWAKMAISKMEWKCQKLGIARNFSQKCFFDFFALKVLKCQKVATLHLLVHFLTFFSMCTKRCNVATFCAFQKVEVFFSLFEIIGPVAMWAGFCTFSANVTLCGSHIKLQFRNFLRKKPLLTGTFSAILRSFFSSTRPLSVGSETAFCVSRFMQLKSEKILIFVVIERFCARRLTDFLGHLTQIWGQLLGRSGSEICQIWPQVWPGNLRSLAQNVSREHSVAQDLRIWGSFWARNEVWN